MPVQWLKCSSIHKDAMQYCERICIYLCADLRRSFHNREGVISESSESEEDDQTAELISNLLLTPYDQLMRAISRGSFPEIAMSVQNILDNHEPILNNEKMDLYLETIKTRNVPVIKEVMSAIRPCALFPKHYKYKLMSESLRARHRGVVDVVCKHLYPRFKLSKEDTVQIVKEAMDLNDMTIFLSVCAPLKNKRLVERHQAFDLLLQSIQTKNSAMVVQILRVIRPKKALISQQKSHLLISSIGTRNSEIVQILLRLYNKIPKAEIEKYLHHAMDSTPAIFLHLIHELRPTIADETLEDLLTAAYNTHGNSAVTWHIIQHFPPPAHLTKRFLNIFIKAEDSVLISVLLKHVSTLTNEDVQRIVLLSLQTWTNLFRFFSGTHDCPSETVIEIMEEHLVQVKRDHLTSIYPRVNLSDDISASETLVQIISSLQYSVSKIWERLYHTFAQSENIHGITLLNHFPAENQENIVLRVLEDLSRHTSNTDVVDAMLASVVNPTNTFFAQLGKYSKLRNCEETSHEIIQNYLLKFERRPTQLESEV